MALYTTLVDDDEDIRYQGAAAVSLLPSVVETTVGNRQCSQHSLSPPAAKCKLLQFLRDCYPTSRILYSRAVEKLIGLQLLSSDFAIVEYRNDADAITFRSVKEVLADAQKPQFEVFIEEKQNLYIDLVEEAKNWAELLTRLDCDVRDMNVFTALEHWTMDGVLHLRELCKKTSDEPIGWASDPETFTVFVRVILAAKVVIIHSRAHSANETSTETVQKGHLEELLMLANSCRLHSLLVGRLENVIMDAENIQQSCIEAAVR